jgi:hypothetical protein
VHSRDTLRWVDSDEKVELFRSPITPAISEPRTIAFCPSPEDWPTVTKDAGYVAL